MKVLVLNAGSSSHKSCLFDLDQTNLSPTNPKDRSQPGLDRDVLNPAHLHQTTAPVPIWRGQLDWSHQAGQVELSAQTQSGGSVKATMAVESRSEGLGHLLSTLYQGPTQVISSLEEIQAVGHRVVHGGQDYSDSVVITDAVKAAIRRLIPLAPAHNPANLEGIEVMEHILGSLPQVAVFDTAFHARMPPVAATYPGPYTWLEQGIRRYGFHGISHQYVAQRAAALMGRNLASLRLITCHLGNGCSLTAVKDGHSIDTTMGFTPLDGLMMGSRSGRVDPGILIHLMRSEGYTVDQLDQVLNRESGLKGISGVSNDMRTVVEAIAAGNPRAQLALDLFIYRIQQEIGALVASLGGLDGLVFTAGIGENSPLVWQRTCAGLGFLGLRLTTDPLERQPVDQEIAASDSAVRVWVIHTQEEWAIAQACLTTLSAVP